MMTLAEMAVFIKNLGIEGDIVLHKQGETAGDDANLERFIVSTNTKYYNSDSTSLLGDFIELAFSNADDPASFVRFSLDMLNGILTKSGETGLAEYINHSVDYAAHMQDHSASILDDMSNFDRISDKLIVRPLNYKNNSKVLEPYVYKIVGDIALVLYAVVLDDVENNCLNTVKIPKSVAELWGKSTEELFDFCIQRTIEFAPPRIYKDILNIDSVSDEESKVENIGKLDKGTIPLLTTTRKTNGAIAVFYPDVLKQISDAFGTSLYIAFTSIHEAMIHAEGTIDASSIRNHIRATNNTFGPEDTLSYEVFFYDRETELTSMVNLE